MTETVTEEGELCLATVIGLFSRRPPGYAMGARHDADLVVAVLSMAAEPLLAVCPGRRCGRYVVGGRLPIPGSPPGLNTGLRGDLTASGPARFAIPSHRMTRPRMSRRSTRPGPPLAERA